MITKVVESKLSICSVFFKNVQAVFLKFSSLQIKKVLAKCPGHNDLETLNYQNETIHNIIVTHV